MKKFFIVALCIFVTTAILGMDTQDEERILESLANECLSLLGKPIPNTGFEYRGAGVYRKDNIQVFTEGNTIVYATIGVQTIARGVSSIIEAARYCLQYKNYLENHSWKYFNVFVGEGKYSWDVYHKNGFYAGIATPTKHTDGSLNTWLGLSADLGFFE